MTNATDAALDDIPDAPAVYLIWLREGDPYLGRTALLHQARVRVLPVGDGQHDGLHGRQPHRKRARVMLDEDAEKTLD